MAVFKGKVIDIKEDGSAIIKVNIPLDIMIRQEVKEVYIEPIDSRKLSDQQRKMTYSLINAISDFSGDSLEGTKKQLKLDFLSDRVNSISTKLFSLSDAPMSLIAEFQKYLIELILDYDVPVKRPLLEYVDDIDHYVYCCLIHKKCVICGRRSDLHHIDAIGMGNDRTEVQHLGREVISLCRNHHIECHTLGNKEFLKRYHLNGGVICDRTLLKIYNLKR